MPGVLYIKGESEEVTTFIKNIITFYLRKVNMFV